MQAYFSKISVISKCILAWDRLPAAGVVGGEMVDDRGIKGILGESVVCLAWVQTACRRGGSFLKVLTERIMWHILLLTGMFAVWSRLGNKQE